ncbi:MAG: rRNA maturation RNase YbeY [Planctomycetota bacterium]
MDEESPYDIDVAEDEAAPHPIPAERIKRAVAVTLQRHGRDAARISVALVDDARMAGLNQRYLGHPGPTDVLSFDLGESDAHAPLEGEIVISWETAAREAACRGHSIEAEAMLYVVHGTLHLVGFDDRSPEAAAAMHAEEDRVLTDLGVGAVYGGHEPWALG